MMTNNKTRSGSAEDSAKTVEIVWVTIAFTQAFVIVLANLLTIITFTINMHLRKRSMYCVINLAVADMLFGILFFIRNPVLIQMYGIESILSRDYQDTLEWAQIMNTVWVFMTMLPLAVVAVERMCATVWPLRHRNARSWAYTLAFSMTWTITAVTGLSLTVVLITNNYETLEKLLVYFRGPAMFLLVGIICVSYIVIFIKVKKQQQQMAGQRVQRPDQRLVMTLCIVTVASIGTWIPLPLAYLLEAKDMIVVPHNVHVSILLIAFSNSLINPIIYVFRMKDFRKALLHLILTCSRHRPTQVVPRPN